MACAETNQWNRHELLQPMKEGTYENGVERHAAKQKAPMNWVPCTFSDMLDLIPLHKYVIIVLGDADNVEGIPFANSLCKHARLGLLPNQQGAYEEVSTYFRDRSYPTRISKSAYRLWFVLHFHLLPPNLCVAIWLCILMNEHYVSWMVGLIIFLLSRWSPCSSCMCYYGHCLNLWHKPLA